ncbi:RNA polymerase sigma factor [Mucilaginibacter sp.]|jgi:RNA polymerase sigma factor (sigma-70 family)|uniref:RNA polymerase sigma factor n=1 Tax=Mucilaginibacter sp. TaxID=1882438 RepID=UPI003563B797
MMEDSELWELFRAGNQPAYTQLVNRHYKPLFNYGRRFCQDREFLMDCIQEVFYELWNRKEKISSTPSVKWYLFKAVRLRVFRDQSKWTKNEELSDEYNFSVEFNIESKIINDLEINDLSVKVKNILNALPPRQQEIMYLRFYEGLTLNQISEIMGISNQSLRNLLQKSYKNFRAEWIPLLIFLPCCKLIN